MNKFYLCLAAAFALGSVTATAQDSFKMTLLSDVAVESSFPELMYLDSPAFADAEDVTVDTSKKAFISNGFEVVDVTVTKGSFWNFSAAFHQCEIYVPVFNWTPGEWTLEVPAGMITALDADNNVTGVNEAFTETYTLTDAGQGGNGGEIEFGMIPAPGSVVENVSVIIVYMPYEPEDIAWNATAEPTVVDETGKTYEVLKWYPENEYADYRWNGRALELSEPITEAHEITVTLPANSLDIDWAPYPHELQWTFSVSGGELPVTVTYQFNPSDGEYVFSELREVTLNIEEASSIEMDSAAAATLRYNDENGDTSVVCEMEATVSDTVVTFAVPDGIELENGNYQLTVPDGMLTITLSDGKTVRSEELVVSFFLDVNKAFKYEIVPDPAGKELTELSEIAVTFPAASDVYFDDSWGLSLYDDTRNYTMTWSYLTREQPEISGETETVTYGVVFKLDTPITAPGAYTLFINGWSFAIDGMTLADTIQTTFNVVDATSGVGEINAAEGAAEYFDLSGRKVASPSKGSVLIRRTAAGVEKVLVK